MVDKQKQKGIKEMKNESSFVMIIVNGKKIVGKLISYDPKVKKYHVSTLEDDYWVSKEDLEPVSLEPVKIFGEENEPVNVKKDNINPDHYKNSCSLECIDAMMVTFGEVAVFHYCCINAFKYLWRYKNKNGLEDVQKAEWYINKAYDLFLRNDVELYRNEDRLNTLSNLLIDAFRYFGIEKGKSTNRKD